MRLVDPCPDQLFKCILVAVKESLDRDYKLILQNSAMQKSGSRDLAWGLREGVKFELNFEWHLNIPGKDLGMCISSEQLGKTMDNNLVTTVISTS